MTKLRWRECFEQAWVLYKNNILVLSAVSLIYIVLFFLSFGILGGVLNGGLCYMLLRASRSVDSKVQFLDMFSGFTRFLPLTGIYVMQNVLIMIGFIGLVIFVFVPSWSFGDIRDFLYFLSIIPGSIVYALLLFTFLLNMDKRMSVMDTFKNSIEIVRLKGILSNIGLLYVAIIIPLFIDMIPYSIFLKILFVLPFSSLLIVCAYRQYMEDVSVENSLLDTTIR